MKTYENHMETNCCGSPTCIKIHQNVWRKNNKDSSPLKNMHSCVTSHKIHKVAARMVAERVGVIPSIANSPPEAGSPSEYCNQWLNFWVFLEPTKILRHKPWHSYIQMFRQSFLANPFCCPSRFVPLSIYPGVQSGHGLGALEFKGTPTSYTSSTFSLSPFHPPNRRKFPQRKTYTT